MREFFTIHIKLHIINKLSWDTASPLGEPTRDYFEALKRAEGTR